jgi:hypothetical protein
MGGFEDFFSHEWGFEEIPLLKILYPPIWGARGVILGVPKKKFQITDI